MSTRAFIHSYFLIWRAQAMSKELSGINIVTAETKKLERELTLLPLFGLSYFAVYGGR
jgi:hypothetical protein